MKALYNIYIVPDVYYCNKYEIIVYTHIIQCPDWKVCRARARNRPRTFWSAPAAHAHFRLVMLARAHMSIMPAQTHAKKF